MKRAGEGGGAKQSTTTPSLRLGTTTTPITTPLDRHQSSFRKPKYTEPASAFGNLPIAELSWQNLKHTPASIGKAGIHTDLYRAESSTKHQTTMSFLTNLILFSPLLLVGLVILYVLDRAESLRKGAGLVVAQPEPEAEAEAEKEAEALLPDVATDLGQRSTVPEVVKTEAVF